MNQQEALLDIVSDNPARVVPAAKRLSELPESNAALLRLLENERRLVNRHGILYALTWHALPSDWELMVRIVADETEHPTVRGQAAEALSYAFYQHAPESPEFGSGVRVLVAALRSTEAEVRYCAANALGATKQRSLIPVLEALFDDDARPEGWVGSVADEARRAIDWIEPAEPDH